MLREFALERWLRAQEKRARFAIGGSGVARGDLAPYTGDAERMWATHPDDASRMLREAVARQYGFDAREVLPTAGASEADAATVLGLAGPGAHVVIEKPAYHALIGPALAFGCRVTRVEREADDLFALRPEHVRAAIGADTKLVVLARPNNPTGEAVPTEELRAIADDAARVGAWVLADEVFADATDLAPVHHERILHVNSVTKCLGFSGLRCGWVAGDPDALEAIDRAKSHLSVQNALLDLQIGARVLDDRPKLLARTRDTRARNAGIARSFLAAAKNVVGRIGPHGTTTLARVPGDDLALATRLAERGVVVAPGSYVEMPGYVRVGLVGDSDALREGLDELDRECGRVH